MSQGIIKSGSPSYVLDELYWEVHHLVLDLADTRNEIRSAPRSSDAIYAVPCFLHAKIQGENPVKSAEEFAERWNKIIHGDDPISQTHQRWFPNSIIQHFEASRGYINVFVDQKTLLARILKDLLDYGKEYGSYPKLNKTMVVDYCSPNIAKPLSVGHLRSTIIGQALINILRAKGYKAVGINFLGDWGTQFGKLLYAFEQWGDEKKLAEEPIQHLLELYVRFHKEAKENPALEDDARAAFKRLQQGGEKERALWQRFRESSLEAFEKTVARLGVKFDHNWFESDFEGKADELVDELLAKGIAEESEGAIIIRFKPLWPAESPEPPPAQPPLVIRKSDGTTLYPTRDLASALERIATWRPVKLLYVVASEQNLYFSQLLHALNRILPYRSDIMANLWMFHLGKLLYSFEQWGSTELLEKQPLANLETLYNRFHKELKDDPSLKEGAWAAYRRFAKGDEREKRLWDNIIIKSSDLLAHKQQYGDGALTEFEQILLDLIILEAGGVLKEPYILDHGRFGMVSLPTGKISTREGRIVYLDELLDEAERRAAQIIKEKNPDMPDARRAEVARQVGIGAVIYADLSQDRIKDIVFDWSKMLAFEGNSAPYLQYAAVRCVRILAKASPEDRKRLEEPKDADIPRMVAEIEEPESIELLMALGRFPQAIAEAAERYAPHALASYLYDLATALSRFYTEVPVLKAKTNTARLARLTLVEATGRVLRRGLALLGIETPEEM